jgi:hypothetical protein
MTEERIWKKFSPLVDGNDMQLTISLASSNPAELNSIFDLICEPAELKIQGCMRIRYIEVLEFVWSSGIWIRTQHTDTQIHCPIKTYKKRRDFLLSIQLKLLEVERILDRSV